MSLVKYATVILLAAAPISESRGAIIYGLSAGLNPALVFIVSVLINVLPILLIFWALEISQFSRLAKFLFGKRAAKKIRSSSDKLERYGELALFTFVALPLPVTGAWMGTLIASLLNFNKRKSFIVISLGVVSSALIVFVGYYGVSSLI